MVGWRCCDSISATTSCLPGTYCATGLYHIICSSSLSHLRGTESRSLAFINGMSGLWSVCRTKLSNPYRNLETFSQDQTATRHSFSKWAYLFSASALWSSRPPVSFGHQSPAAKCPPDRNWSCLHWQLWALWHHRMLELEFLWLDVLHYETPSLVQSSPVPYCISFQQLVEKSNDIGEMRNIPAQLVNHSKHSPYDVS